MNARIGSLFSGYGGLDMGVKAALGGETAWFVEYDKAPSKILAHHWPDVPNYGDITKVDWSQVEPVDILTGGSPCQDLSHAGKRQGMTEGTRSNLWVAMREAIAQLRPSLVVWENVRGAYSAEADSDLELCPRCVGDPRDRGPVLRALGRVLGDLADLGFDAEWIGLRAADVGAPHNRFRVFVVARRRGFLWSPIAYTDNGRRGVQLPWRPAAELAGPADPARPAQLFPTPRASDGTKGGPNQRGSSGDLMLPSAVTLLPTPAVNDMGEGKTVEAWDEWTAKMQAAHSNGNGHGKSLAIEAQRMATTKRGGHVGAAEGRPDQVLRDVRDGDQEEAVRKRATGGQERLPSEAPLLADVREQSQGDPARQSPLAGAANRTAADVRGVRHGGAAARPSHRPEPGEQPAGQPHHPLCVMPSSPALAGGPRAACGCSTDWGVYTEAIRRWEWILGRAAPSPTQQSTRGRPQLDPRFSEFLMGLPAGHVTDVPGLSRNDQLKALGNGVVPAQAAAAIRYLLSIQEIAA